MASATKQSQVLLFFLKSKVTWLELSCCFFYSRERLNFICWKIVAIKAKKEQFAQRYFKRKETGKCLSSVEQSYLFLLIKRNFNSATHFFLKLWLNFLRPQEKLSWTIYVFYYNWIDSHNFCSLWRICTQCTNNIFPRIDLCSIFFFKLFIKR